MAKQSLSARIYQYLKNRPGVKVNGGDLERLALSIGYKASNASRRCRELAESGQIRHEIIDGTVWYWYEAPALGSVVVVDGRPVYKPPAQAKLL